MALLAVLKSGVDAVLKPVDTLRGLLAMRFEPRDVFPWCSYLSPRSSGGLGVAVSSSLLQTCGFSSVLRPSLCQRTQIEGKHAAFKSNAASVSALVSSCR